MPNEGLTERQIREKLKDYCDNPSQCGLDAYIVKKGSPKLRRMALSEETNEQGKSFRILLKEMFFEILEQQYLAQEAEYANGRQLADNQHKYMIFEQGESFHPFTYLSEINEISEFTEDDLLDASGLIFCIRKGVEMLWIYQHLWSIMVPNKKRTNCMARLVRFENQIVFSEQRESLLTIAKKIDILILDDYLITNNTTLLQKNFGFQDYIYQSAQQTIQCTVQKNLVENIDKLSEYIGRGKAKYAKK